MSTHNGTSFFIRALQGALGGLAATITMSALLGLADRLGVMNHQPPRKIIETVLPDLSPKETDVAGVVAHLGYGITAGGAYGELVPAQSRNLGTGIVYGLVIWAIGYEGWLPALGVLPPAHRDKPGRAAAMLLAHVVYGATLGIAAHRRSS